MSGHKRYTLKASKRIDARLAALHSGQLDDRFNKKKKHKTNITQHFKTK